MMIIIDGDMARFRKCMLIVRSKHAWLLTNCTDMSGQSVHLALNSLPGVLPSMQ